MPKELCIAVAGKGGTGKTSFASLLIRYLVKHYPGKDILAVDADANANLNEALGLELEETISDTMAEIKDPRSVPSGMSKDMFIEFRLSKALVEADHMDLLAMGNPSGPGCYCFPNDLLRKYLEKLRSNYDFVVVDNEAGLEHLSRRIISGVDHMIITSDASVRGIRSAGRISQIVRDVGIDTQNMYLLVGRMQDNLKKTLEPEIAKTGLNLLGYIPYDPLLVEYDVQGKPLYQLPDEAASVIAVEDVLARLLEGVKTG